jgi:transcription elongation factor
MLPFTGDEKGKIRLIAKGNRMTMIAQSIDQDGIEFNPGDEVVVVKVRDSVAEVVKPI